MENFLTPAYRKYMDGLWDVIHTTHSRFLHPGEEAFIPPEAIRAMSLTGTQDEVLERVHALESAGLTHLAISPPWNHIEESIVEFAAEVVRPYREAVA